MSENNCEAYSGFAATPAEKPAMALKDKVRVKLELDKKPGTAPIKVEFIDFSKIHKVYGIENIAKTDSGKAAEPEQPAQQTEAAAGNNDSPEPPPSKRAKKKQQRGQNKKRPANEKRAATSLRLCHKLVNSQSCSFGDKCIFSHDIAKIMQEKPPDLGKVCHSFETLGKCERGIMCRFGSAHITADFKNVVDEEKWNRCKEMAATKNIISKDVQHLLRKRKMKFARSDKYMKELAIAVKARKERHERNQQKQSNKSSSNSGKEDDPQQVDAAGDKVVEAPERTQSTTETSGQSDALDSHPTVPHETRADLSTEVTSIQDNGCHGNEVIPTSQEESTNNRSPSGAVTDEDVINLRQCEKKCVDFKDKLYLAPLTTVGNLPFRRICKGFGADITCGEMAVCTNLLQGQASEWALLKRHPSEDIFGVQIAGAFPDSMTRCAEVLSNTIEMDFLDVNVGCPIDLIYSKGAGSGLMNRMSKFEDIVRGMSTVLDVPLTVKMRTGVYDKHLTAAKIVPKLYDWGASVVSLHGRTREQRYTKSADWDYIADCVQAADPYPLLGNGDILSYEDANYCRDKSGVAGIMIARGALIKPWIFTEIKEQRHWDISAQERLDNLKTFVNYGFEHWGSDTEGVEKTRRFLLEWLSFLYRYIPVGILERVPQTINDRPPHYVGRNDLETLMGSAHCEDWVKISEMLLGPVPETFKFLPKHKANSYK